MTAAPRYWFDSTHTAPAGANYRHSLLVELPDNWDVHRNLVVEYFREAHADARNHLATLANTSLHPAGTPQPPYDIYPFGLPQVTLQGYFGEILTAYLAERMSPGGFSDWKVPAHLFRMHLQAFQYLEQRSQNGNAPSAIVGRTGDDCLAFRRDADGAVVAVLFCEAKCTATHDATLIRDAHEKLSASAIVDVLRIVEILKDSTKTDAVDWIASLRHFHLTLHIPPLQPVHRIDLVCYVHSTAPIRNPSWISNTVAHASYTARRPLDVYEVRMSDVVARIREIYSAEAWR